MEGTIADVRCLSCGAPAKYDVIRQSYVCAFCGGQVELSQAQAQKRGFRQLQQEKIRRCIVPRGNAYEGAAASGPLVYGVSTLQEMVEFLNGNLQLQPAQEEEK